MTLLPLLAVVALLIYFIPSMVARKRKHEDFGKILALNFFVGWTFIGWVIALVWALTVPRQR
jgi:hypothetical protein